MLQRILRDANPGVGDRDEKHWLWTGRCFDIEPQIDAAALREFHRIADEIQQDLAEARGVARERCGQFGRDRDADGKPLALGSHRKQRDGLVQDRDGVEGNGFDYHVARFEARIVKDRVDDAEQVAG